MSIHHKPAVEIVVLDDDYEFLRYIADLLSDDPLYSVSGFAHPNDVFEAFNQHLPDILLLDIELGETRGDELLPRLLARWPNLCVIIVTGHPSLENMRDTFRLNVFDYLSKPFSLAQLRQTLSSAVETYGLGRCAPDCLREKLGHQIRVLRAHNHWSIRDLAKNTQLSISQISSIERGASSPSMESLLVICQAFRIRPSELLSSIDF